MIALITDVGVLLAVVGFLWLAAYAVVNKMFPRHDFSSGRRLRFDGSAPPARSGDRFGCTR